MALSVHTNVAALTALQNLNKTNDSLGEVQSRINTGLAINNAKDNAAVWAIAQGQRDDIGALSAVKMSLDRAKSIADVAMSAGESVSDLLVLLKEKVLTAMDPSLSTNSRNAVNNDYKAILRQITQVIENSTFDAAVLGTDVQLTLPDSVWPAFMLWLTESAVVEEETLLTVAVTAEVAVVPSAA